MKMKMIIENALAYSKMTKTDIGRHFGITQPAISERIKNSRFTKEQLEEIASVMGAKYYCYFEFPDGTRIGDYNEKGGNVMETSKITKISMTEEEKKEYLKYFNQLEIMTKELNLSDVLLSNKEAMNCHFDAMREIINTLEKFC